jgi:predicted alpha-1,6-mannanase (GH76 family)
VGWRGVRGALALSACLLLLPGCAAPTALPGPVQAGRAGTAVSALQATYYDGAGRWRGAGYWNTANAFSIVLDEYQATGAPAWRTAIREVYRANSQGTIGNFTSNAIDDEQWWGLDWVRAWDLTGDLAYLDAARAVFSNAARTWDGECGGGVWWTASKSYKNAITNELFLLLAVELHEVTPGDAGPGSYLSWAEREANWFLGSGMINPGGLVNDGLTSGCRNNGGTTWTYNQGVILAGLAELYHVTGERTYLDAALRIANAATARLARSGVLYEVGCEPRDDCDSDQQLFKGIFIRYLWWLYQRDPEPQYRSFIRTNLDAIWADDRTGAGTFGIHWAGPVADVTVNTDIEAVEAFTATSVPLTPPRRAPAG